MRQTSIELAADKDNADQPVGHLDIGGKVVIFTVDGRGFYGDSYEDAENRWHEATGGTAGDEPEPAEGPAV